jgi:hypothetical protein
MEFVHGSKQNILDNEDNSFKLFDYIIDHNNKPNLDFIDNGLDAQGFGLYAFIGNNEKSIENASCYTDKDSGFLYIFNVDVEESNLMNNRDADEISIDELVEAIDNFIFNIREDKGFNKETFDNVIEHFESNFDYIDFDHNDINLELAKRCLLIELDEYSSKSEYGNSYEWKEQIEEQYSMSDPCSNIEEEGGSYAVAEYCINKSDNLWETIKNLGFAIAVLNSPLGTASYNKTFQKSILESLGDKYDLTAAHVNDGNFAVIFDTDKIVLEDVVDLKKENDLNLKSYLTDLKNPKSSLGLKYK